MVRPQHRQHQFRVSVCILVRHRDAGDELGPGVGALEHNICRVPASLVKDRIVVVDVKQRDSENDFAAQAVVPEVIGLDRQLVHVRGRVEI